jgi:hypothetical protein
VARAHDAAVKPKWRPNREPEFPSSPATGSIRALFGQNLSILGSLGVANCIYCNVINRVVDHSGSTYEFVKILSGNVSVARVTLACRSFFFR